MTEPVNYRWERIERLMKELEYEIKRGMMEGEINESIGFRFIVPTSKSIPSGVVCCEFRTRPTHWHGAWTDLQEPRLKVVK